MTYKEGWEEILLFSLGVMEGMQSTQGFKNELCVLESFVVGEALQQGHEGRFSLESVLPGWRSPSQLGSGTGNEALTFPFHLVPRFRVSVTT